MKQLVLEFTSFWREETSSKKFLGILLIILSQFLLLLLVSYTGNRNHIFGSIGYEFAHFFIAKFLGITAFFFPLALMYWGYHWLLKKKNSGEVIRELFFLFGCIFCFNMLLLNGFFINTKWAGLFPRFFHAIVYFIFDLKVNQIHGYPILLETLLFLLFAFLLLKNYVQLSLTTLFKWFAVCGVQLILKLKVFFQFLKKKKQNNKTFLQSIKNLGKVISTKLAVHRLEWGHIDFNQQNKLKHRLIIKLDEPISIDSSQKSSKPAKSSSLDFKSIPLEIHSNHSFDRREQDQEIIDLSSHRLFHSSVNPSESNFLEDYPTGNQNTINQSDQPETLPLSRTTQDNLSPSTGFDHSQTAPTDLKEKSEAKNVLPHQHPLPSIINLEGENQEKRNWLAEEAHLLYSTPLKKTDHEQEEIKQTAKKLEGTIQQFGITTRVVRVSIGPVITQYELMIEPGVKITKIIALSDNISLALAAISIRILAPIPGKAVIGIEVPNKKREIVTLRDIISKEKFKKNQLKLPIALGASISGEPTMSDLSLTPHLLVAGATGSGKSVCINAMIISLLLQKSPLEVRFIMIDPKMVELNIYNGIPHLLAPVITDHKKAAWLLRWAISEMEVRYRLLEKYGVRSIDSYNQVIRKKTTGQNLKSVGTLPYIVVIIDEFADLMMVAKKEIEDSVSRLAAMSRAIGIHLILATQRPSVDVITGVIKANFPSRIAFQVSSKVDSRTIIDSMGAEKLLGQGDLLYQNSSSGNPQRIQGAFLSDNEVKEVVEELKKKGKENYLPQLIQEESSYTDDLEEDAFFSQAMEIALQEKKISASYLQRRLKIGYNRAARIVEMMEEKNIVSRADGSKPREVLI